MEILNQFKTNGEFCMFNKVVISLCASVMLFGCPKKKSDVEDIVGAPIESGEAINIVKTDSKGVETKLKALRYNLEHLSTPESIVVHGSDIYVANIGGQPGQSPDMGFITKFDGKENVKLCDGDITLNDPKGFAFMGDDYLLISNHPNITLVKIMGEDKCSIVQSTSINGGAGFLNDVVLLDNNTAFVTDTGKGLIYKVTINEKFDGFNIKTLKGINHNGINGAVYNEATSTLFFVTSTFGGDATIGDLYSVQLNKNFNISGDIIKWNDKQIGAGGLDGIALMQNNKLIVSDWGKNGAENNAMLYVYDIPTKKLLTTISGDLTSTADITTTGFITISGDITSKTSKDDITSTGDIIYIPEFSKNRIISIEIDTSKEK